MPACRYVEEIGIAAIHAEGYRLINISPVKNTSPSLTAKQEVYHSNPSILPAEIRMWGKRLVAMLVSRQR